jgi:hypothetical protein
MLPLIHEALASGGVFTMYPKGTSMLPLIRPGTDGVELAPVDTLAKGDIILYCRGGDEYVLHRIVGRNKNGFVLCGDNQFVLERFITDRQVEAKVSAILRESLRVPVNDEKYLKYVRSLPYRRFKKRLCAWLSALKHTVRAEIFKK